MEFAVLCGRNNCGKSYLLKTLAQRLGERASYLGPARYQNFTTLNSFAPQRGRRRHQEQHRQFVSQWQNQQQNIDNSPLNLQQAIAELTNEQRSKLKEIMDELLDSKMQIDHTEPANDMSQKYISVDGHNISFTSSGYRLIAALITSLLDEEVTTILIDEPELGISPEAQGLLADFLFNKEVRKRRFHHLKSIILATHSTLFLDRTQIANNYFVAKTGDVITLEQVKTYADINRIHFFLLGNRFESLYLPSVIVIVEGKTDRDYLERVLSLRFPDRQISVLGSHADNRTKEVLHMVKMLLGDLSKSPYRDRIFVVLDKVHEGGLKDSLERMGLPRTSIIIWSKNGIEHYYPTQIMEEIFGAGEPKLVGDTIELNGVKLTKAELGEKVVQLLLPSTDYPEEFNREFLDRLTPLLT